MLTFGFATQIDVLSWIIVIALGLKVVTTILVLVAGRELRDQPGWGSTLWWTTKITPVVAVPCLIGIALLEGERTLAWSFVAIGLFVAIAVPLKVRQRRRRITRRASESPLGSL
jgi:hypothetical protein